MRRFYIDLMYRTLFLTYFLTGKLLLCYSYIKTKLPTWKFHYKKLCCIEFYIDLMCRFSFLTCFFLLLYLFWFVYVTSYSVRQNFNWKSYLSIRRVLHRFDVLFSFSKVFFLLVYFIFVWLIYEQSHVRENFIRNKFSRCQEKNSVIKYFAF